jgi:trans-aconitate methyltransferase
MDLGCGNGWFSRWLYTYTQSNVQGIDVNQTELETADRLFANSAISFHYADIYEQVPGHSYGLIIINAAVQYFPDLPKLITYLRTLLSTGGEIHILDSPFYSDAEEAATARKRSAIYYADTQASGMASFYHHHTFDTVTELGGEVLYHPLRGLRARLVRRSPFPWIRFRAA